MEECIYPPIHAKAYWGRLFRVSTNWRDTMNLMEEHVQDHLEDFRAENNL